jgi:restriction system protein
MTRAPKTPAPGQVIQVGSVPSEERIGTLSVQLEDVRGGVAAAPITVKAFLLKFGARVDEGTLVEDVALPWYEMLEVIRRDPDRAHEIGAERWEEIIAGAYRRAGYDEVILTPRSGDKGRDIIASKLGVGCIRIVDQMKAYRPGHVVTAEEVRAMVGVLTCDDNVSKGIVTTTSTFAPRIAEAAGLKKLMPYRLELKPREVLLPWLDEIAKKRKRPR